MVWGETECLSVVLLGKRKVTGRSQDFAGCVGSGNRKFRFVSRNLLVPPQRIVELLLPSGDFTKNQRRFRMCPDRFDHLKSGGFGSFPVVHLQSGPCSRQCFFDLRVGFWKQQQRNDADGCHDADYKKQWSSLLRWRLNDSNLKIWCNDKR